MRRICRSKIGLRLIVRHGTTVSCPRLRRRTASPPETAADYYRALGMVPCSFTGQYTAQDIKEAFHAHAKVVHPDVPGGDEAEFRNAKIAYECLRGRPNDRSSSTGPSSSGSFYDYPRRKGTPSPSPPYETTRHYDTPTPITWRDIVVHFRAAFLLYYDLMRRAAWRSHFDAEERAHAATLGGGEYGVAAARYCRRQRRIAFASWVIHIIVISYCLVFLWRLMKPCGRPPWYDRTYYTEGERVALLARPDRVESPAHGQATTAAVRRVAVTSPRDANATTCVSFDGFPFSPEGLSARREAKRWLKRDVASDDTVDD